MQVYESPLVHPNETRDVITMIVSPLWVFHGLNLALFSSFRVTTLSIIFSSSFSDNNKVTHNLAAKPRIFLFTACSKDTAYTSFSYQYARVPLDVLLGGVFVRSSLRFRWDPVSLLHSIEYPANSTPPVQLQARFFSSDRVPHSHWQEVVQHHENDDLLSHVLESIATSVCSFFNSGNPETNETSPRASTRNGLHYANLYSFWFLLHDSMLSRVGKCSFVQYPSRTWNHPQRLTF